MLQLFTIWFGALILSGFTLIQNKSIPTLHIEHITELTELSWTCLAEPRTWHIVTRMGFYIWKKDLLMRNLVYVVNNGAGNAQLNYEYSHSCSEDEVVWKYFFRLLISDHFIYLFLCVGGKDIPVSDENDKHQFF